MGLRSALARSIAGPAPTFVVVGRGGREAAEDLRLDARLVLLDSPRSASILLIVGSLTDRLLPAAMLAHDQMPRPRAAIRWRTDAVADPLAEAFPGLPTVKSSDDAVAYAMNTYRALVAGDLRSTEPLYPDVPPVPWRGVGPYGHGGKGMTGGVPFGRPMAERAPDRDGLELDQLRLDVGPIFPAFPPGLILSIRLQGDVVQEVTGWENALFGTPERSDPFRRALREPVPIAELEVERARHHLRWLSRTLRLHGLGALGLRVLALAVGLQPRDAHAVASLRRRLERNPSLAWATERIGVVGPERARDVPTSPVARASGVPRDARANHPAYERLGFEPITQEEGDARARWRQRLGEAAQALDLAARAGDRLAEPSEAIESPRGELRPDSSPSDALLPLLPALLTGREWGETVSILHDLDLDMEESATAVAAEAT